MCLNNVTSTASTTSTEPQVVRPPKLVRGFSSTPVDLLAKVVVAALKEDIPALQEADVSLKDCSGYGGCRTYKASLRDSSGSSEEDQSPDMLPPVVLHSRLEDHDIHFMSRLSDAHAVFAAHGLAPPRLAEGSDWFVGQWAGSAVEHSALDSIEGCIRHGALYAKVHSVDPAWFEPHRAALLERAPQLKDVPPTSHIWAFASRGHHCDNMCELYSTGPFETQPGEVDIRALVADMAGPMAPQHPLTRRLVTTHGDLHCQNALDVGAGKDLQCIDFEFSCAAGAYFDLGAAMGQMGWEGDKRGVEHRRAFLRAYTSGLGQPMEGEELDALLGDVMLSGGLAHFHAMGLLAPWSLKDLDKEMIVTKLSVVATIAEEIRSDPTLLEQLLLTGLKRTLEEHPRMKQLQKDALRKSKTYQRLQSELDALPLPEQARAVTTTTVTSEEPAMAVPPVDETLIIQPVHASSLVLQVKPGTDRLELTALEGGEEPSMNQQWRVCEGERLQHVTSGLFLDAPVCYVVNHRDTPWEAGGELYVKPRDLVEPDRQRWVVDGELIRHRLDGRALDVNFWDLEPGRGVNLNVPRGACTGCSWSLSHLNGQPWASPEVVLEQLSMKEGSEEQSEKEQSEKEQSEKEQSEKDEVQAQAKARARDWERYDSLAQENGGRLPTVQELHAAGLKQLEEERCWVPITFTGAEEYDGRWRISGEGPISGQQGLDMPVPGGAAWARIEVKHDRKVVSVVKSRIPKKSQAPVAALVVPKSAAAAAPPVFSDVPQCTTPIADVPEGAEFYLCPAASEGFGLMVGHNEKEPETVTLGKLTGDAKQKWTLVDGDAFKNVGNGEYLDSDLAYAFIVNDSHIWESNHTDLRTAPRSVTGSQKWMFGPEEFHGGKVLRHWMDGRGLDIHGWQVTKDGCSVGVENSVHADCKGISYVLRLCDDEAEVAEVVVDVAEPAGNVA